MTIPDNREYSSLRINLATEQQDPVTCATIRNLVSSFSATYGVKLIGTSTDYSAIDLQFPKGRWSTLQPVLSRVKGVAADLAFDPEDEIEYLEEPPVRTSKSAEMAS